MRDHTALWTLYVCAVSLAVIGCAFVSLYWLDRKAQRDHDIWKADLDSKRPANRTWS